MANFLAVYDPDDKRRQAFERKCTKDIAIFDDLKKGHLSIDKFSVLYATNASAPVDTFQTKNEAAILFGDAIRPGKTERLTAKTIAWEWRNAENAQRTFYDGYYCSVTYSIENGLTIGGDILGVFPIYYFNDGPITLIGSSPELFKHHEKFNPELCIEGLTGILMTIYTVEGLTLWKNVFRLNAGHLLIQSGNGKAEEVLQFEMPLSEKYYEIPFNRQVELIDEKFKSAIARHAPPDQPYSLLFSGGLDSRMLAGYLRDQGNEIKALTFGKPSDMEMKIATKAMKALPFEHTSVERSYTEYAKFAKLTSQWEHGLHGFNSVPTWSYRDVLRHQNTTRVISGIYHDMILSGGYKNVILENDSSDDVFSKIFSLVNTLAIPVEDIRDLYREEAYKSTVSSMVQNLKNRYLSYSQSDFQRSWCFEISHRGRFHLGGVIWKMSFGAWPVIPIIDSAVLEVCAGLPNSTKSNRRAQRELVMTCFPELARISFDNNTNKPAPLIPTWQFLLKQEMTKPKLINRVVEAAKRKLRGGGWNKNLSYHRVYNINNEGWKEVRKAAEPMRKASAQLFNPEVLEKLVPPPETDIDKLFWEVSGMKSLLGFLLWLRSNQKNH